MMRPLLLAAMLLSVSLLAEEMGTSTRISPTDVQHMREAYVNGVYHNFLNPVNNANGEQELRRAVQRVKEIGQAKDAHEIGLIMNKVRTQPDFNEEQTDDSVKCTTNHPLGDDPHHHVNTDESILPKYGLPPNR